MPNSLANPSSVEVSQQTPSLTVKKGCKISIIASDLSSSGAGRWKGAVRPFLLAQALQALGCEVEILGFSDSAVAADFTADLPITAIAGGPYPQFLRSAQQLLSQAKGDILYAYKLKPSSFGLALAQRLWSKRPVILDIDDWELSWHGGDSWRYQAPWRRRVGELIRSDGALRQPDHPLYLRWIERCVGYADAVTAHSEFLRSRFGGHYVPNGKDTDLFDPSRYDAEASRARYSLSAYRVLMFPGAPRPYKGLEDILTAVDQLNQSDLRVVIVGGSPYDDYDQQLIQRWGRWIIKLPKTPYEEMPAIVAAAHVVIVPQRDSPAARAQFPLKLTDGMAMAKPILATRVGDIPTILQDTGYLVEPGDTRQMAATVAQIFEDFAEAEQRGRKARQRCVDKYSIRAMSQQILPVLQSLNLSSSLSNL
ncbi:MAG: glycosyltransferase family 4 protein [Leptolyngbya sp. SIO4C1]|nr:glycosyltransferase family 4 protein [Leptolyngbya sp. SIO4C1]